MIDLAADRVEPAPVHRPLGGARPLLLLVDEPLTEPLTDLLRVRGIFGEPLAELLNGSRRVGDKPQAREGGRAAREPPQSVVASERAGAGGAANVPS